MTTLAPTLAWVSLDIKRDWLLTANQRMHWRQKATRTAALRVFAHSRIGNRTVAFDQRVHCTVTVAWPNARRRDVHNLMPTIKALIDGVVDAGWLEDDDDKHLTGPDLRVSDERCAKDLACTLELTFAPVA